MDTTFSLLAALPATRAFVGQIAGLPGAVGTANAGIPLVVEQIVRHSVFEDIAPDPALGPIGQRVDFNQLILRIPHHQGQVGTSIGLIPAEAGQPGIELLQNFL